MASFLRKTKTLTAAQANHLDKLLMSDSIGYSIDQLMELAGLSVAEAVYKTYPAQKRVLVVCGPGNNGGDGLVAARHLSYFGFRSIEALYSPKKKDLNPPTLFQRLVRLLEQHQIPVRQDLSQFTSEKLAETYDIIVDALFGFSFQPPCREPYQTLIKAINGSKLPVVCVDVPSGWDVDEGLLKGSVAIEAPKVLVSLTAPKKFTETQSTMKLSDRYKEPNCVHFLGGRFIPKAIADQFDLNLPLYEGTSQAVQLTFSESDPPTT